MLEIKIIQIIIPLIFAIGIIAIIYTFLKEPRIILGDLFSAIYFRIKEEFFGFLFEENTSRLCLGVNEEKFEKRMVFHNTMKKCKFD